MITMNCHDCGTADMPLDTVLTGTQWEMIFPERGGVLCASCICKRASKFPNVINLTVRVTFSDDWDGPEPGGKFFQFMKRMDAS